MNLNDAVEARKKEGPICECTGWGCRLKLGITWEEYRLVKARGYVVSIDCATPPLPEDKLIAIAETYKIYKMEPVELRD